MKVKVQACLSYRAWKSLAIGLLAVWATAATYFGLRNAVQKVVLIGIDEDGARIITSNDDPLITRERMNLVREFISYAYSFDQETYEKQIGKAGNLMADALWSTKEAELRTIQARLKESPLLQMSQMLDFRDLGNAEYGVDLKVTVKAQKQIQESVAKYRITLKLKPHRRTVENPYGWEIISLVETPLS